MRTDLDTIMVRGAQGPRVSWSQYMKDYDVLAFVIIQRDTIVYESYRGGLTDSTIHNSFSVAKSVLSNVCVSLPVENVMAMMPELWNVPAMFPFGSLNRITLMPSTPFFTLAVVPP